jgi:hypothetical protein
MSIKFDQVGTYQITGLPVLLAQVSHYIVTGREVGEPYAKASK